MKTLIFSKNPFYKEGRFPCYLAGYTVAFVAPLIEHLLQRNHDVAFLSPLQGNVDPSYYQLFPREPKRDNFLHLFLDPKRLPKVPYKFPELETKATIMEIETMLGAIEIVLSVYVFPWVIPIAELKNRLGYKIAAFLRGSDLISGCDPNSSYSSVFQSSSAVNIWERITELMKMSLSSCDRVYVVSKFQATIAHKLGIKVNGIFPSLPFKLGKKLRNSRTTKKELRCLFQIEKQAASFSDLDPNLEWIAYLGRVYKEKCIALLLESVPRCRSSNRFQLLIAGDGPDVPRLKRLAAKLGLKVSFGFVAPRFIPLLCKAASVVVHPTLPSRFIDAAPSSCINASFVGTPIIFPYRHDLPCSGIHEYVSDKDTATLSFNPDEETPELTKDIARRIDLMIEDPDLRQQIEQENIEHTKELDPDYALPRIENELMKVTNS